MLKCNMSPASRVFLEKHLPHFFDCKNLDEALLELDNFITMYGLDKNDDMTLFGHEAQAVYDEVFWLN